MQRFVVLSPYGAKSHAQWAHGLAREIPLVAQRCGAEAEVDVFDLPGRHWKWRMAASALVLVERMSAAGAFDRHVDAFIVTDMMDVGQFRAALPPSFRTVPVILYFHENQLTFPDNKEAPPVHWDRHYAFINVSSALLADAVLFNSEYHKRAFLEALPGFLGAFPSPRPLNVVASIESKSKVVPIGLESDVFAAGALSAPSMFGEGPPVVVWNHRWEFDKGPDEFYACLQEAANEGVAFRLAMLGQQFGQTPPAFDKMKAEFGSQIVHWGHVDSRGAYVEALRSSDIALVTSHHDFYGLSVLESAAVGLHVVAPDALSYPEHFGRDLLHKRGALGAAFVSALRAPQRNLTGPLKKYAWDQAALKMWEALNGL
ncbi:MAG: DUF3524 domain-containing protein [Flavobacteriales bacterium]|nr:DUF3524 domain-containing protein [Flavobacteriales bacterium]